MENVFTKREILEHLAKNNYFIDEYTLGTFFDKWKIEAVFENEEGIEFFDRNAFNIITDNLFNTSKHEEEKKETENTVFDINRASDDEQKEQHYEKIPDVLTFQSYEDAKKNNDTTQTLFQENFDGLIKNEQSDTADKETDAEQQQKENNIPENANDIKPAPSDENQLGELAYLSMMSETIREREKQQAQEAQKTLVNNEFKLDISEKTLGMIARTIAKKIIKHVNSVYSAQTNAISKLEKMQEENALLVQKNQSLEEQNKKLRMLLAASNKNLNSYKPSIFGLYKKINTKEDKRNL